jgi:3-carboxy-cis,cis-muconate cycloisomerase
MSVHGSSRAMALALARLQVNPQRMRTNLDAVRASLPKAAAEEWFNPDLAQHAARMARSQLAALRGQGLPG